MMSNINKDKIAASNPAPIDGKHVKAFFQGYKNFFSDKASLLPLWKKEQIIWRLEKAKACVDNKSCLYCGCSMPHRAYSDIGCEDPIRKCYPEMMNKETWEKYKIDNNIEVHIAE